MDTEDEMRARARDFLRDAHLELPRSAERRLMFALETFRTAARAEGVREERERAEKIAKDEMGRMCRCGERIAAAIRGQP